MQIVNFNKKYSVELSRLWLMPKLSKYLLSTKERTTPSKITKMLKPQSKNVFIALENNKVIGFIVLKTYFGRKNHCADFVVFVAPNKQKKGIGTTLIRKIIERAKELGLKRIELGVFADNKQAIKLYKKLGFKKEGVKRKALQRKKKLYDEIIMGKLLP